MTDQTVLTEAEIDRIREIEIKGSLQCYVTPAKFARAIEAAVLAKLMDGSARSTIRLGQIVQDMAKCIGGISEAEARERERRAWWMGFEWAGALFPRDKASKHLDSVYPSLNPKLKTVTLSDGSEWVYGGEKLNWRRGNDPDSWGYFTPPCKTPEDYEKVAAFLRECAK